MEGLGSDTGEVAVEALPGAGVGGSEVALDTGEVVFEAAPGAGVGGSEVALDAGEVVVAETPGAGAGGSEVALDAILRCWSWTGRSCWFFWSDGTSRGWDGG